MVYMDYIDFNVWETLLNLITHLLNSRRLHELIDSKGNLEIMFMNSTLIYIGNGAEDINDS